MASNSSNHRWDVEFSRFFNYPRRSSMASSRLFRFLTSKPKRGGTWISAESLAILQISRSGAASSPVLSVTLVGIVVEEHYISNLHFAWPQVSCVPECPVRGSRAVFFSYADNSGKIQKFAVRFPSGAAAEAFLNCVKDQLHDIVANASSGCDIVCENSSPTEITASRLDEESSYEQPLATYPSELPAWTYNDEQSQCNLPPLLANNIDTIFSGFPRSFTDLLTNCLSDAEKEKRNEEKSTARDNANTTSSNQTSLNLPSDGPAELSKSMAEEELKTHLMKYMTDASFHDMLFKIEKVIDELGGDLSL